LWEKAHGRPSAAVVKGKDADALHRLWIRSIVGG
jgi:hypothetical protein